MKSRNLAEILVIVFLAARTPSVRSHAQEKPDAGHHYKLIDMGTFAGPLSYFNSLNLTDVSSFCTVFYDIAQVRNA